jgi:hypothetical protein
MEVRYALASFSEFYMRKVTGRRLEWDGTLSMVELELHGRPFRCDAVVATFLLAVVRGNGSHTLDALARALGVTNSLIQAIVKLLKSSRLGQFVIVRDSIVSLNPELIVFASLVIPPAGDKTQPGSIQKAELPAFMSEGSQIDAVLLRILKEKTSLTFSDLLAECIVLLRFTVSADAVNDRLKRLESRHFLAQDASGGWKYLP